MLYFLQAASIYPKTFQLDTFKGIELVLQAQPLEVNEQLDVPLYKKKQVEISFPICKESQ